MVNQDVSVHVHVDEGAVMNSGFRIRRSPDNDCKRNGHHHPRDRWNLVAALLSIALMLATVSLALWSRPAGLARAQDEIPASDLPLPGQVIAQGIARLPRGQAAWTVSSIDVTGD